MEEKQKVQVVFEIERPEYDAYLFLLGKKKSEVTEKIWNAMCEEPVAADVSLLDEDEQAVRMVLLYVAISSIEQKVKEQ